MQSARVPRSIRGFATMATNDEQPMTITLR